MPIKFSELTTKPIADVSKIVGLYVDNTSNTGASNCIISVADFAKQAKLTEVDDSAVHKSGSETITGAKTFSNEVKLNGTNIINGNLTITSNPALKSNDYVVNDFSNTFNIGTMYYLDKNSTPIGYLKMYSNTDGKIWHEFAGNYGTNEWKCGLKVGYDSTNNRMFTQAPTPPSGDNSTQIATTNWCVELIKKIYPVGSIYIGTNTTCPMATIIPGSTWTLVAANKALWTGSGNNGNTTIEAGLPNITGTFFNSQENETSLPKDPTGAFARDASTGNGTDGSHGWFETISFNASRSSPIYGNSTTVQPPAYVVNVWRRTA